MKSLTYCAPIHNASRKLKRKLIQIVYSKVAVTIPNKTNTTYRVLKSTTGMDEIKVNQIKFYLRSASIETAAATSYTRFDIDSNPSYRELTCELK